VRLVTTHGELDFEVYLRLRPSPGKHPRATLEYTLGGYTTGGEYSSGYDLTQGDCVSRDIAGTLDTFSRTLFLSAPGKVVHLQVRFKHPAGKIDAQVVLQAPLPGEHPDESGGDARRLKALGC